VSSPRNGGEGDPEENHREQEKKKTAPASTLADERGINIRKSGKKTGADIDKPQVAWKKGERGGKENLQNIAKGRVFSMREKKSNQG